MAMSRPTRGLAVLAALLVTLALAASAWAHPGLGVPPAGTEQASASVSALVAASAAVPAPKTPPLDPLGPALPLAVLLGAAMTVRRRLLVTALALVLVVLAVETGVHSVHHLADRQGGSECVVALASAHVHGTAEPPPALHDTWIAVPVGAVVALTPERPGTRPPRPDEGRAPPAA
jgi:hypothetical protein